MKSKDRSLLGAIESICDTLEDLNDQLDVRLEENVIEEGVIQEENIPVDEGDRNILSDVESDIPVDENNDPGTIDEQLALNAIMECGEEFYNDLDSSLERLTALRNVIKKYGICKAVMEAVDPKGELVQSKISCSYENLSEIPEKGDVSECVVANLDELIRQIVILKSTKETT